MSVYANIAAGNHSARMPVGVGVGWGWGGGWVSLDVRNCGTIDGLPGVWRIVNHIGN